MVAGRVAQAPSAIQQKADNKQCKMDFRAFTARQRTQRALGCLHFHLNFLQIVIILTLPVLASFPIHAAGVADRRNQLIRLLITFPLTSVRR